MSKELETITNITLQSFYAKDDLISKSLLQGQTIKHEYYELVNSKGKIICAIQDRTIAIVAANRMGLNYRKVEFKETFKEV